MYTIRKYEDKDFENVRAICIATSGFPTETVKDKTFLYAMYNDYYTQFEKDNCFVAADENDKAVGYILCAEDFDSYEDRMKRYYLPGILSISLKSALGAIGEMKLHKLFKEKYPAHLHIDISPDYQHMGMGSKLTEALVSHLGEKGVKGLMLSAGMMNKNAISFYKKNGFKKIANIFGSVVMGIEF